MNDGNTTIEAEYKKRIAAMTPAQRVARSAAMFQWTREQIARRLERKLGTVDAESLKWRVALELYGHESTVRTLIEGKLRDVSS